MYKTNYGIATYEASDKQRKRTFNAIQKKKNKFAI